MQLRCASSVSVLSLETIFTYFFSASFEHIFPSFFFMGLFRTLNTKVTSIKPQTIFPVPYIFSCLVPYVVIVYMCPFFPLVLGVLPPKTSIRFTHFSSIGSTVKPSQRRIKSFCCKDLVIHFCPQGALAFSSISIISRPDQASFLSVHYYLATRVPRNLVVFFLPKPFVNGAFFPTLASSRIIRVCSCFFFIVWILPIIGDIHPSLLLFFLR